MINIGNRKSFTYSLLFFICLFFLSAPINQAPGKSTEAEKIDRIRKEYTRLNKGKFKTKIFEKYGDRWGPLGADLDGNLPSLYATIYFDDSGKVRKCAIIEEHYGEHRIEEYFWPDGRLFFYYRKDIRGGSGVWWDVRLYFWEGVIIRNLAAIHFKDYRGRNHTISDGMYKYPSNLGYHKNVKQLRKEFNLP